MQKNTFPKIGTLIPPIMLAGLIITSNLQQELIEKLMHVLGEPPEQHCEVFPPSDSFGFTRDNRTANATGTNTYAFFGGNNSNEMIIDRYVHLKYDSFPE